MSSSDSSSSKPPPAGPPSSGPGSGQKRPAGPQQALDALLLGAAGDPVRRALWLDAVDQRLRTCLSPPLAAHARLANVDRARLVFIVDAPVWHAKLRMAGPQLLDAARSLGLEVATLVIRVGRTPVQVEPARQQPGAPMSASARRALEAALAGLNDPPSGDDSPTGHGSD